MNNRDIVFLDLEVNPTTERINDIGALRKDGSALHVKTAHQLSAFIESANYLCGHNIIHHDAQYIQDIIPPSVEYIDTLYLSPLLFPKRPYHRLLKDEKIRTDELNNPLDDCRKALTLFYDEVEAFHQLGSSYQQILYGLLASVGEFKGFFHYLGIQPMVHDLTALITMRYQGQICSHADIALLVRNYPVELAYALTLIATGDPCSITPPWVLRNYPKVQNVIDFLRHRPCTEGCEYCRGHLDIHRGLKRFFGYDQFRTFDGEPMQERAVQAAIEGHSILTIFPTGGGKSLTFQLPALMEGENVHGLTVIISPLQSLMKDQVDNLTERGISSAVTINGLLDPINRSDAIRRVADGTASLLYISPEMLRSKTIERLLIRRQVVRFVIDEAHCFSAWGQDFRVDYLYIGPFIKKLQQSKCQPKPIPVSCFTATAKQKVITDICDYFKRTIGLDLQIFASSATRQNLHYAVIHVDSDEDKYTLLRNLLNSDTSPAIVYVSRTRKTRELAAKLTSDGIRALPFNGQMDANDKVTNQNAFMNGETRVIVATSAFGMGVDKKDVGMVVHYDISDSLENYVQEAGRAGRDPQLQARCYVLYGDQDLDKHFMLLNQTKLSLGEIQQVWKAIRELTRQSNHVCCSSLEIARQAGWDESVSDIETRVRTAVSALEQGGHISRGNNVPHIYASGITVRNMEEARRRIVTSSLFESGEHDNAIRIIKSLITSRATQGGDGGETRIDYLADILGLDKRTVISTVERMRMEGILADSFDIVARIPENSTRQRVSHTLERALRLEQFLLQHLSQDNTSLSCRQLNDKAAAMGIRSTVKEIRTLLYFLTIRGYIRKQENVARDSVTIRHNYNPQEILDHFTRRIDLARFAVGYIFDAYSQQAAQNDKQCMATFSVVDMLKQYQVRTQQQLLGGHVATLDDIEEALLYLSKVGAIGLEGGFLILYNAMEINRLKDNRQRYKVDDYRLLDEFYKQKIQQVHIVGEYANLMVRDYTAALQYVQDYFQMDYKKFLNKYFKDDRLADLQRNITPAKYRQVFGGLSDRQREIIDNHDSRCIVVAAGPGSGKTRVLVHKLASLMLMEDVKHEQLLMLTFSRAAATEFKQRLLALIGNAAHFVEIKTFHSYCFDLLGRIGSLEGAKDVVARAVEMIKAGEVEPNRINKSVLVIDEAQDMNADEYALVQALMQQNEGMRVIAVGDDDQNVYQFRGSDSQYMQSLITQMGGRMYEMTDNYRSAAAIVTMANTFARHITSRMKDTPIAAVRDSIGRTIVTQHADTNMEQPLVNQLLAMDNLGSTAILTHTNEEALRIVTLLRYCHIPSRLIQSLDGFRFADIAEVRYFTDTLKGQTASPIIPDTLWTKAKEAVLQRYAESSCLNYIRLFFETFEQTHRDKYLSDLQDFVRESSIEDFCPTQQDEVLVSTIHKAKGREFDTVFLYVTDNCMLSDDYLRQIYVGITRAKTNLFIHCSGSLFNHLGAQAYITDAAHYTMPPKVTLQLGFRDVYLDFFKSRAQLTLSLHSGTALCYADGAFHLPDGRTVARLSVGQRESLQTWLSQGYRPDASEVRYVVFWHPRDDSEYPTDVPILLIDLTLTR